MAAVRMARGNKRGGLHKFHKLAGMIFISLIRGNSRNSCKPILATERRSATCSDEIFHNSNRVSGSCRFAKLLLRYRLALRQREFSPEFLGTKPQRLSRQAKSRLPHENRLDANEGGLLMLKWAAIFFVVAIVAALLGFTGVAGAAAGIAKFLFFLFVAVFVILLIVGIFVGKKLF
jgi:uncharacterized membrane protein YtjA (UPF0391 family)